MQTRPYESWSVGRDDTGRRVTITTFPNAEYAADQIAQWRARDARGGRPDISHLMPHLFPMLIGYWTGTRYVRVSTPENDAFHGPGRQGDEESSIGIVNTEGFRRPGPAGKFIQEGPFEGDDPELAARNRVYLRSLKDEESSIGVINVSQRGDG